MQKIFAVTSKTDIDRLIWMSDYSNSWIFLKKKFLSKLLHSVIKDWISELLCWLTQLLLLKNKHSYEQKLIWSLHKLSSSQPSHPAALLSVQLLQVLSPAFSLSPLNCSERINLVKKYYKASSCLDWIDDSEFKVQK